MSSTNAPFGLRPAFHPSGLDRAQALANGIQAVSTSGNVSAGYATTILKGQPVKMDTGGYIVVASNRPGGCGGDDIYATRLRGDGTIDPVSNLGCDVDSAGSEASPFPLPNDGAGPALYFSSTATGAGDLYLSQ